jgi:hypothetical protein
VYVSHIPQRALGHKTPREALLEWYERSPGLFRADPHNHPGLDSYILRIADGLLPRVEALGGDVVLTRLAYRDLLALVADQPRRGRSGGGRGGQAGRRSGARPCPGKRSKPLCPIHTGAPRA